MSIRVAECRAEVADEIGECFEEVFRLDDGRILAERLCCLEKLPVRLREFCNKNFVKITTWAIAISRSMRVLSDWWRYSRMIFGKLSFEFTRLIVLIFFESQLHSFRYRCISYRKVPKCTEFFGKTSSYEKPPLEASGTNSSSSSKFSISSPTS